MYSPKIKEDLIPLLYKVSKRKGIPMTKIVDELLRPGAFKLMREVIEEETAFYDYDEPQKRRARK